MQEAIIEALEVFPDGLTCDELEALTGMKHQTCSARVRELSQSMRIFDSGMRRATRSGRSARVYKL